MIDVSNLGPKTMSGFIFSIKSVKEVETYKCPKDCYSNKHKKSFSCSCCVSEITNESFNAIEIVVNVIATDKAETSWWAANDDVICIDSDGFTHNGKLLCYNIPVNIHKINEGGCIVTRSQGNMVYTFKPLSDGRKIHAFVIKNGSKSIRFDFYKNDNQDDIFSADYYKKISKEQSVQKELKKPDFAEFELLNLIKKMNATRLNIYKRLNTEMIPSEARRLEESIKISAYELELDFSTFFRDPSVELQSIINDFRNAVEDYQNSLAERKKTGRRIQTEHF